MSLLGNLYNSFRRLIVGEFAGLPLLGPSVDYIPGREEVLKTLGSYLKAIQFLRDGGDGKPPTAFSVKDFFTEQPDNETDLVFPSIAVVASRGEYLQQNLTPYEVEESRDVFGRYTILRATGQERREVITLDCWAASRPERRAMLGALPVAFNPRDGAGGLRLVVPSYYGTTASFSIVADNLREDTAVENRRTGVVEVEVVYPIVHLIKYVNVRPTIGVDVQSPGSTFVDGTTDLDVSNIQ